MTINILLSLIVLIPIAVACIGLGLLIGSLCTENQVPGPGNVVIFGIVLFGGVWMDLEMIGGFFETVGYALPFAHAIDATRELVAGATLREVLPAFYWLIPYTLLFFLLGTLAFRWKTRG